MTEKPGIVRLTVEEYEECIEYAVERTIEKFQAKMDEGIREVKDRKESLRLALVEEGYHIPQGLNLEEWIPYIKRSDKPPKPITYERYQELMKERDEREHPE